MKNTRRWPLWARFLGAIIVTLICIVLRVALPWLPAYPVLLSLLAIFISALLFERLSGYLSLALVDIFAVIFYLPHAGLALQKSSDVLGLLLFNAIAAVVVALVAALHNLSDRLAEANGKLQSADARIAAAERDKTLLVKEAGHRIKNNLSTLIGVINVQERSLDDPTLRSILRATAERIQVFARVHDRLEATDSKDSIDLPGFLQALCDDLRSALGNLKPITISLDVDRESLPQKQAVAIGLCVNELVANAMKHGFPDEASGAIEVSCRRIGEEFRLCVTDDGLGIGAVPKGAERRGPIGLLLVRAMVAQLSGSFNVEKREPKGTQAQVRFPAPNRQSAR